MPYKGVRKALLGVTQVSEEAAMDADALTLIAAMSPTPDNDRQLLINETIVALKAAGIWSLLDELWFFAAHSAQAGLLGWKRYKDCTAVSSPNFVADRGYRGNGTDSYINTNYAPADDGINYTLDDCSFGNFTTGHQTSAGSDMGGRGASSAGSTAIRDSDASNLFVQINRAASSVDVGAIPRRLGLRVGRRVTSTHVQGFLDGIQIGSDVSAAATGLCPVPFFIGGFNNNGAFLEPNTRRFAFAFFGAALTTQQQAELSDIVYDYLYALVPIVSSPAQFDADGLWRCPSGVTSLVAAAWGGGGKGSTNTGTPPEGSGSGAGGRGGGGGAYARSGLSVTPGKLYSIIVGPGGMGNGGDTGFYGDGGASDAAVALGGTAGTDDTTNGGGIGGNGTSSIGNQAKFWGGNGGVSTANTSARGGGGGGAAGSAEDGGAGGTGGTSDPPGAGGAGGAVGGGDGGDGGLLQQAGQPGTAPGGGGGGCGGQGGVSSVRQGGAGAPGRVILTY